MNAGIPISSTDFRRQLSEAPEADWSRREQQALANAQKTIRVGNGDDEQLSAVCSENTSFGWLTWGISPVAASHGRAPELVAVGIIDKVWAAGRMRSQAALAHAERRRRVSGRPRWLNARLLLAAVTAFLFIGIATNAGASTGWPVSVGIALGVLIYNFAAIARRWSRKHVRVFSDTALAVTRNDLYALLSPVSAIARTAATLRTSSVSPADQELVDGALSEALKAVWQATDPASTRAEVDAIRSRLDSMATAGTGILRSVADVDSATYMPIGPTQPVTATSQVAAGHPSASRRLLSGLDASTQAILDRISAQEDAAQALRQINQPPPPANPTNGQSG